MRSSRVDHGGLVPRRHGGRATFEWMPGKRFLVERWGFPRSASPGVGEDNEFGGIAIVGLDTGTESHLQHYFDSRGVAASTRPTSRPWISPSASEGSFSEDGTTIEGHWEISHDGARWEHDFDLRYTRPT